ncbi:MAG: thymidine phosphorylase [Clostridiales bacterium]|nr:thymidine phosphorylase [Clostridiales bacterium]
MDFRDIILDKRYGKRLSHEQMKFFVDGVTSKSIPEYQISALLMAIVLNGMDSSEMTDLALLMASSGKMCDLSMVSRTIVDKHSTGGVGDKCTPIILPLVASFGVPVVKLSGRGLGFTGGTIDKLESIVGFETQIPVSDFPEYISRCNAVLSAQTPELAPADKELYSIRDVTGTVDSIPLIASSIMSKKIAGGANAIVLDVTCGDGAFMKNMDRARDLANAMIDIGKAANRPVMCVISSMQQPLGSAVGNALEMKEVESFFDGKAPDDLRNVCVTLAASMLIMSGYRKDMNMDEAKKLCENKLDSGAAKKSFLCFVKSQGGQVIKDGKLLYRDEPIMRAEITADKEGYIQEVFASKIGKASVLLGAGRKIRTDAIDHGAGIFVHKKIGDHVRAGERLCALYTKEKSKIDPDGMQNAFEMARSAFLIEPDTPEKREEVIDILT